MPMMCCSPDFTAPDPDKRKREIEREAEMIACHASSGRTARGVPGSERPALSGSELGAGSRLGGRSHSQHLLPVAREYDIVLGMENHYKDGFWQYPEFAQKVDRFLAIVDAIEDRRHFGVQYDPSNAIVAGDDPIELLRAVADRVVSMHASDRYLAPGATLDDLAPERRHARLFAQSAPWRNGQGLERLRRDFPNTGGTRYTGWVSIEDGMNGMDEMAESLRFPARDERALLSLMRQ